MSVSLARVPIEVFLCFPTAASRYGRNISQNRVSSVLSSESINTVWQELQSSCFVEAICSARAENSSVWFA